jgi:2-iminobutanoate/2-iminopropanoate deaminase
MIDMNGARLTDRKVVTAPDVFRPSLTYSHAVVASGLVFVSGTMAHHPQTGKIVGSNEREQLAQALHNVSRILAAAGTTMDKVVSATLIMMEDVDFASLNLEWAKWFPVDPPARQGARFPIPLPGVKVSVAVVAAL